MARRTSPRVQTRRERACLGNRQAMTPRGMGAPLTVPRRRSETEADPTRVGPERTVPMIMRRLAHLVLRVRGRRRRPWTRGVETSSAILPPPVTAAIGGRIATEWDSTPFTACEDVKHQVSAGRSVSLSVPGGSRSVSRLRTRPSVRPSGVVSETPRRIAAPPRTVAGVSTSPSRRVPSTTVVSGSAVLTMLAELASIRASPS